MDILRTELYKILWKRKGVLLILLFVLFKAFILSQSLNTSLSINYVIEENKEQYQEYLGVIEGELTDKKKEFIENILNEYDDAEDRIAQAGNRSLSGEISQDEYASISLELKEQIERREMISQLKSQYTYVLEDKENRYFIYPNGWVNLFTNSSMDLLQIMLLLILITPISGMDFETNMHPLNLTSKNGKNKLYIYKLLCACITATLVTVVFFGVNVFLNKFYYGLSHPGYPLQSIAALYSDYPWKLTIGEGLAFIFGLKLFGNIYLAGIIVFSTILCRKSINSIFLATSFVICPYFLFEENLLYHLPLPITYNMTSGYLNGIPNLKTGVLEYIPIIQVVRILFIAMGIVLILLLFGLKLYKNSSQVIKSRGKKIKALLSLLCLISICTGCTKHSIPKSDDFTYNYSVVNCFVDAEDYLINCVEKPYQCIDKKSNESTSLFSDPFLEEEGGINQISYTCGNNVYYLKQLNKGDHMLDFAIFQKDIVSGESKQIYIEHNYTPIGINFMNLYKEKILTSHVIKSSQKNVISDFFVVGQHLYMLKQENLYQLNLKNHKKELLINDVYNGCISYEHGIIYYMSESFRLLQYSLETEKKKEISKSFINQFMIKDGYLIYQTMQGEVILFNTQDKTNNVIAEDGRSIIDMNHGKIFYTYDFYQVFEMNYSGKKEKSIYKGEKVIVQFKSFDKYEHYYLALLSENIDNSLEVKIIK